jgi:hypothetical protein
MPTYKVGICQFPGGGVTSSHTGTFVTALHCKMRDDPRIGAANIWHWQIADTPITMGRNKCLRVAEEQGWDYVLMLDSDMVFDMPYPGARPFWEAAWEFALAHDGPCVVAAPYVGPPPVEVCYVFRYENNQSDDPNPNFFLRAYGRHEAAQMTGVQRAGALPTGLMLIDMRAVRKLKKPYFYYEWADDSQSEKASTEDVTFSRDLAYAGVPLYCAWDSWAGHIKQKICGKPQAIPADLVPRWMTERAGELFRAEDLSREAGAWKEKPAAQYRVTPKPGQPPIAGGGFHKGEVMPLADVPPNPNGPEPTPATAG